MLLQLGLPFLRGDLTDVYKVFTGGLDLDPSLFSIPPVRLNMRGHPLWLFLRGEIHNGPTKLVLASAITRGGLTTSRTEALQARRSCASSLETFTPTFLHRAWPKTRGPEIGSRSALVVVANVSR